MPQRRVRVTKPFCQDRARLKASHSHPSQHTRVTIMSRQLETHARRPRCNRAPPECTTRHLLPSVRLQCLDSSAQLVLRPRIRAKLTRTPRRHALRFADTRTRLCLMSPTLISRARPGKIPSVYRTVPTCCHLLGAADGNRFASRAGATTRCRICWGQDSPAP